VANPLSSQCSATSKRSGCRCRRMVVGGGVCAMHGGAAPQVRAARKARIIEMEAELEAAKEGQPYERRHPGDVLMDAVMASDVLLQHLLRKRASGELTAEESTALNWAIDRAARTSKTALDANVSERLVELQEQRIVWNAQDRAQQLHGFVAAALERAPVSAPDKLLVWRSLFAVVAECAERQTMPRLGGSEVQAFTRGLEAAAEGRTVWSDVPDTDIDSESGSGDVG
jgi:hypothetical protein